MVFLLIGAMFLVLAQGQARGAGLILLGILVHFHPNLFTAFLFILGLFWLFWT